MAGISMYMAYTVVIHVDAASNLTNLRILS